MNSRSQWRHLLTALRGVTGRATPPSAAARFAPLAGVLLGLLGALIYWLAAQLYPTSIAVVLSMLATTLVGGSTARDRAPAARRSGPYWVFVLLLKYNALMALSAANGPVRLPEYLTLGLIMVAGHAAGRALSLSLLARPGSAPSAGADLTIALAVGMAPAALLGLPGLIGVAAAIAMRLALGAAAAWPADAAERPDVTQNLTEICFYLGALAAWKYV